MRDHHKIKECAKILEEWFSIVLNEDQFLMLASEEALQKTWDNPYDKQWDNVL